MECLQHKPTLWRPGGNVVSRSEHDAEILVEEGREYLRLRIEGAKSSSEIFIGDDHSHPVLRSVGSLDEYLLPGFYTVQFALRGETYPLTLEAPVRMTEAILRAGPTCPQPKFRFYEEQELPDDSPTA
jgi:hypothetical protein